MAMNPASFTSRDDLWKRMRNGAARDWDLIVVGGGICGAGILREAVRQGYRALLIEQRDFAWGTSSRSSQMVHGGLRYLGMGDTKLTRDSLTERERLLREAPGLVERASWYFTVRKRQFPGRFPISILMWLYDRFAGIKDHRYLQGKELRKRFAGLSSDIKGAGRYTDSLTNDARLVLRVLLEAIRAGGSALNYVRATRLLIEDEEVCGVAVEDVMTGDSLELRAPVVISATGAWADRLRNQVNPEKRVRPLRGSHLVIPKRRLSVTGVLSILHPQDKRPVYAFPWEGATVLGTTDLDHPQDLDVEASISDEEVEYLLEAAAAMFPQLQLCRADVISSWAGVRPVIGTEQSKDPSKERRDHAVWSDKGLVSVSGGKLTTFRLIALDALEAARPYLPAAKEYTDDRVFAATSLGAEHVAPEAPAWGHRLLGRYGDAAMDLLSYAPPEERQRIDGTSYCLAECRWAAQHEAVQHLDDLLLRRTRLGLLLRDGGKELFDALQKICCTELGWDESRWETELGRYRDIVRRHYALPASG
jgi:glycerol-3-phosphate dehydrogenase